MIKRALERIQSLSIGKRLTLTMWLTAVLPILLLFSLLSGMVYSSLLDSESNRAQLSLNHAVKDLDTWVASAREHTAVLASNLNLNEAVRGYEQKDFKTKLSTRDVIHNSITSHYVADPGVLNIVVYLYKSDAYFTSSFEDAGSFARYEDAPWFHALLEGRSHQYSGWAGEAERPDVYIVAYSMKSILSGEILGLVYTELSSSRIESIFRDLTQPGDLIQWQGQQLFVGSPAGRRSIALTAAAEEMALTVTYRVSTAGYLRSASYLSLSMLLGLAALTLLLFWVCRAFSRWFTWRIVTLRNATVRMADGHFDLQVEDRYHDELTELSDSFNQMSSQIRQLIQDNYLSQIRNQEAQLIALQSQINPHFIYNTLESLSMMALIHDNYEIVDIAQAFSQIMRYSMQSDAQVTVADELDNIRRYLSIQEIRFPGKVKTSLQVEEACYRLPLLRLTLQPLVENSFTHGFEEQREGGLLRIILRVRHHRLLIYVIDNGKGISRQRLARIRELIAKGDTDTLQDCFALRNLAQRLKLTYGEAAKIYLHAQADRGTIVMIRLPIREEQEA